MTAGTLAGATSVERIVLRVTRNTQPNIPALNSLAVGSLHKLFDEREKLFFRRVTWTESGMRRENVSGKLTAIALLGLQRLTESGATHPFDIVSIQDAIWKDRNWVIGIGDLGLLTWFTAVCRPDRLASLFQEYDFDKAIVTFRDAREGRTTGLARFLAGIAHARLARPNATPDLTDIAVDIYHLLADNQSESGICGHAAFPRFHPRAVCNRFGTFADQMFSIYALTTFARAFQIEEPLVSALSCANSLRDLQGEMGQWWFLYDRRSCCVVNRYPVYSVNQYGIAPVGFLALEEATGQTFRDSIYKGLSWTLRANELEEDLRDMDCGLVWDSVRPIRTIAKYWEAALSLMNMSYEPRTEDLMVCYEARPDHFGWLLYAFGSFGLPNAPFGAEVATTK